MEKRIYLASKGAHTVGVDFNITKNEPIKIEYNFTGETEDNVALRSLIAFLKETDTTELTNVVPIFINSSTASFIVNGGYKFWIKTGLNSKGQQVSESDMALIKEFDAIWKEKGDDFVIRDIFTCRIKDETKADPAKLAKVSLYTQQNEIYSSFCWEQVQILHNASISQSIRGVIG